MNLMSLFIIFFKIGLFTIGGGLAALPLMQEEVMKYGWMDMSTFADMIAVSQSTPGPIGINMATYIGYHQTGVVGSIVATVGLVMPSLIIICIIAKFLSHFNDHPLVKNIFYGLRPAVVGLIFVAAFRIAEITLFELSDTLTVNYLAVIMFLCLLYGTNKFKHHPAFYIILSGILGVVLF